MRRLVLIALLLLPPSAALASDGRTVQRMSAEDRITYDVLKEAVEKGEASKFPPPLLRFCPDCREYNAATDASNAVLKQRMRELEDKYRDE
jgi:hypothetical protein